METLALPGFTDRRPSIGRIAVVALLLAALLGALLPDRADAAKLTTTWFGWSLDLTKAETNAVAAGFGSCAVLAMTITDPTISKAVGVACGLATVYAAYIMGAGRCLRFYGYFVPMAPTMMTSYVGPTCR